MSRYIDADKLLTDEILHILPFGCGRASGRAVVFVEDIEKIPTADVVEVVHSSFVWIADDSPMCNICGKVFDTNDDADAGLWKFCPECGAKMDGERSENGT